MSSIKSMIALLFALGSAGALAQDQASPTPPPSKPVDDSAVFGPVLNPPPQASPKRTAPQQAAPQQAGEAHPQAQEERAGLPPQSKQNEVDPSARPAPEAQPPQGQQGQQKQAPKKKGKQAARHAVQQQIVSTPRIVAPEPRPAPRVQAAPAPVVPSSTQVMGCMGGTCTDTAGTAYNTAGPANTAVSSSGQLCTRTGTTMQCF